ncbi:hypothetical protein VPNG_03051 [Cytospora leucostoma]|uniref:Fe2OG dioxygenase domain-containing protein n=1 Tax=Cytospora leucostoma TaxID=1230097 RepID=A0A423XG55_9PEZI|nr:hypothetical protein VPNG_03051 [Cytospora leucostoma]
MAVSVPSISSSSLAVESPDDDLDLFGEESSDTESYDARTWLQERADAARREKLARLPPPSDRTCAQNRTAYVLSGQRLQPTRLGDVFAVDESELVIEAVVDYVQKQGGLQTGRHESFATTDVPVSDLSLAVPPGKGADTVASEGGESRKPETVGSKVLDWVEQRVLSRIASATGFRPEDLGLKDLFVVCYTGRQPFLPEKEGAIHYPIPSKQASLAVHTDGCLMSFSLLLNHQDSFNGGGTFFKATGDTFHLQQGELLMHDAGLEHAGAEVISGQRIVLVGFVETVDVLKEKMRWEALSPRRPPQRVAGPSWTTL